MPELTPRIFETIFFQHIKSLTAQGIDPRRAPQARPTGGIRNDRQRFAMDSFDYQFSDQFLLDRDPFRIAHDAKIELR